MSRTTEAPRTQSGARALTLKRRQHRTERIYDQAASSYTVWRRTWLAQAGAAAEARMLTDLAGALHPGARVLDAGSGTGALSRDIQRMCPEAELTMADLSAGMLGQAGDVRASKVVTDVQRLPFRDESFDVVVSSWVIETVENPREAVSEYLRVLAQDGRVFYTFCSRPDSSVVRLRTALLRAVVRLGFAGHFLHRNRTPWHDCGGSHRLSFDRGLTTEIALSKCCTVDSTQGDRLPKKPTLSGTTVCDRPTAGRQPGTHWIVGIRHRARAVRNAATGLLGGILGLAPHVLHHVAFLAGTAVVAGSGGTALFGALGLVTSVPFLLRLYRRFHTWRAPAMGIAVFAVMFAISAFLVGPAISGTSYGPPPTAPTVEHNGHH